MRSMRFWRSIFVFDVAFVLCTFVVAVETNFIVAVYIRCLIICSGYCFRDNGKRSLFKRIDLYIIRWYFLSNLIQWIGVDYCLLGTISVGGASSTFILIRSDGKWNDTLLFLKECNYWSFDESNTCIVPVTKGVFKWSDSSSFTLNRLTD